MRTYYVATRPETVLSMVKRGCFPTLCPAYVNPKKILFSADINTCVRTSQATHQQTFILELNCPASLDEDALIGAGDEQPYAISQIRTDWIKQIIVYSEASKKLLERLFTEVCPLPIVINPGCYPQRPPDASPRFFQRDEKTEKDKKQVPDDRPLVTHLSRLSSREEHVDLLKFAFRSAKHSILLTTYGIDAETLRIANLYKLISEAHRRGVNIYIYCNDAKEIDDDLTDFFGQYDVLCDQAFTHSKILAVDKELVVLGSFNWLSHRDPRYPESLDGSLVCRGDICNVLISDLWQYIRYYRHHQFGYTHHVMKFERQADYKSTLLYDIDAHSSVAYIPTLEQHRDYLQEIFERARQRIVVCSPFISSTDTFLEDFTPPRLIATATRGVKIVFVCSMHDPCLTNFQEYIRQLQSSNIQILAIEPFHLKTIVVDDNEIAEGSFNWLSAMRDCHSEFHNHEVTLRIQGDRAKPLIDHFNQSKIGQILISSDRPENKMGDDPSASKKRRLFGGGFSARP
ncbi:MAG: phospholipase D-like domain-containing protein [Pseudomonadota bacterium]